MKRSRLILLVVTLLALTLVLAACGGDDDNNNNAADVVATEVEDTANDVENAAEDAAEEVEEEVTEAVGAITDNEANVSITDNEYSEASLSVDAGTTVTWVNEGTNTHTVTADDGSFDSGDLEPGDSFSYTFDDAGTFDYHCEYHGDEGMTGSVEVASS
jgi:plastocyanin